MHHMAAMDLHGNFAGPEFRSYLFIKHAGNHQDHHFALAHGECRVAFSHLSELTLVLTCETVAIQCLMDGIQQVLVAEGFGQELHGTGFHGSHCHGNIRVPGDEDDGNLNADISQLALELQTVDPRESDVENEATWPIRPLAAQELLRGSESL